MKKALSFLVIISVVIVSCKKDSETPYSGKNSYQPVSNGSFWKYMETGPSGTSLSTLITMTGATKTINSRIYYQYTTQLAPSGTTGTGYVHSENGIIMSAIGDSESLYLKENAAIGETWVYMQSHAGSGSDPIIIIAKMIERGITRIVDGKTFTNVIHTKHMQQLSSGATVDVHDYYTAKGTGMIERRSADGTNSSLLVDYAIK